VSRFDGRRVADAPWAPELTSRTGRWTKFLATLEERLEALVSAGVPAVQEAVHTDPDVHHRAALRLQSGLLGQVDEIRQKMEGVLESEMLRFADVCEAPLSFGDPAADVLHDFREDARAQAARLEARLTIARDALQNATWTDPEAEYVELLAEHARTAEQMCCTQCGARLIVDRVYHVATYLACPQCRTRNTFEPGTRARQLDALARRLADHRTTPLREAYERATAANEAHTVRYERYARWQRAYFDEWTAVVPDLAEQHETFYARMLADFQP
jgi:hypothetical protein